MAKAVCIVLLMLMAVALAAARMDFFYELNRREEECRELRSSLQSCRRQQQPTSRCCEDASEYRRKSCQPREIGEELLQQCRSERHELNREQEPRQCRELKSRMERCSRQDRPSRQCCEDAQEYRRHSCQPRELVEDITEQCQSQRRELNYDREDQPRQCQELKSRMQRCSRQDRPSSQCCEDAQEYRRQRCQPRELGEDLAERCESQRRGLNYEDREDQPRECRQLKSRMERCSRQDRPSRQCCEDAQEYRRQRCQTRELVEDITQQCESQRRELNYDQPRQCQEMKSRMERCSRQDRPSRQCCEDACEYRRQRCQPRELGEDLAERCESQRRGLNYEDREDQPRQCRQLRSRMERCSRQERPSRECCEDASEYRRYGCQPRELGEELVQQCESRRRGLNDERQCQQLRSRMERCSRQERPSRECCEDASEYRRYRCQPRQLGEDLVQQCESQRRVYEEEETRAFISL